jgi:hypothetical protein
MNIATTTDISITGTNGHKYAGGIAGEVSNGGKITNFRNAANAVSASFPAGLGRNDGYLWYCGGITGYVRGRGNVLYCYVTADIRNFGGGGSGDGMRYAGGIAGAANAERRDLNKNSTVTNCVDLSESIEEPLHPGQGSGLSPYNALFKDAPVLR